jgi:tetratricopeptide (TPR) repeat protein
MDHASPLLQLQTLAEPWPEAWITAALAGSRRSLEEIVAHQRAAGPWNAPLALRCAHLWLAAGWPGQGDDLVLEASDLAPQAGLIPDWWGFWPDHPEEGATANAASDPQDQTQLTQARELGQSYLLWRHLAPLEGWKIWLQAMQGDRRRIDEPAMRLLLGLVIARRQWLPGPLEPTLEKLFGEDEDLSERHPALAWRFFDPLCERLPQWSYARLKAADLSLQRGDLERCRQHLDGASDAQWQLAWLHDIAARRALAEGDVEGALAGWQRAIERCNTGDAPQESQAEVVEIFRQRAREARRGPGVLQARSLLNRGESQAAICLLETLLDQDPQWQPLRSLLEQARLNGGSAGTTAITPSGPVGAVSNDLERLEARLEQLADRAGLPWPPPLGDLAKEGGPERDAAAFEQFLQTALGRVALLG